MKHIDEQGATIWPERHVGAIAGVLAWVTAVGFAAWIRTLEGAIATPDGTVRIVSASFGENCGAPKDNVIQWVKSACSGKSTCNFTFDWRLLGDPAPRCAKQLKVEWQCSTDGNRFDYLAPSDPAQGAVIRIACD